jgi:MFS family permease
MTTFSLGRSLRLSVAEGGLATSMGSLFSGVFLTGFAVSLGASRLQIGILFALPALCGLAQMLGSYWIERWGHTRWLCLSATLISRVLYLPALVLPLVATGLSAEVKVWMIVGVMALSNLLGSIGGVAWLTWIKGLVPAHVRVHFFGRRNLVNTALSFSVCLAGGFLVDAWGTGDAARVFGFTVVFGVAMACGLASWWLLAQIPEKVEESPRIAPAPQQSFREIIAAPLREANFRRVVFFYTAWTLATNLALPFIPVFFMQKLGLPFWAVIVLSTLSSVAGMCANGFWTRFADRFGMKPAVLLATFGEAFFPLALVFVSPAYAWALIPLHLFGVFNTPLAIGPDNFVLKLAPDHRASPYMAIFRAFVGPTTAIAAIAGGWLAGNWASSELMLGPVALGGLKIVLLLSFLGRIASLGLLWHVVEPEAHTVQYVARVYSRSRSFGKARRAAQASPGAAAGVPTTVAASA